MSRSVVLMTPAKVNLTLEVLGRRADGYHDLASVFATVDLRDRVRVAPSRELDVRIAPSVGVPAGEDLASRAVRALAAATARPAFAPLAQEPFLRLVSDAFRHRRKQVRSALGHEAGLDRARATEVLASAGIAPERRPETLSLDEWIALARATGVPEG